MKRPLLPLLLSGLLAPTFGQTLPIRETLEKVSAGVMSLWGIAFTPDVAVIYPASDRMTFYRQGEQATDGDTTSWDRSLPAANSTAEYRGGRCVTLVGDRLDGNDPAALEELLAHESFHYYQDSPGIPAVTSANAHLDSPEGRALLHMEFDALRGNRRALTDALEIRRNDWSEFIVEAPRKREGNVLTGDNYRLELASGWEAADNCGVWRLRPTQP